MEDKVIKVAENIVVTQKIGCLHLDAGASKGIYPYYSDYYWDRDLGKSYHQLSYTEQQVHIVGREAELSKLINFLESGGNFKVGAITGRAGNGKSDLVYHYCRNMELGRRWRIYGVTYEALEDATYDVMLSIGNHKILLVIDYVLAYAEKIGRWIKRLQRNCINKEEIVIRVLLLERVHVEEDKKPYWYIELVQNNRIEDICDYKQFIQLNDLSDEVLGEIFVKYVQEHKHINVEECKKAAYSIIGQIEENCKTPLFIKYIADAWMEQPNYKSYRWNKEETLHYMVMKEEQRIRSFSKDTEQTESLLKIIVLTIILSSINIGRELPECLRDDWNMLSKGLGSSEPNLYHIFGEIEEVDCESLCLKSNFPDILGELFCLEYLEKIRYGALNKEFVSEFVGNIWKIDSWAVASFLYRIIEDFPGHKIVSFSEILQKPSGIGDVGRVLYADVLREYTYWNDNSDGVFEKIIEIFKELVEESESKQAKNEIYTKFAVALFNMIEWRSNAEIEECCKYLHIIESYICKNCSDNKTYKIFKIAQTLIEKRKNCYL